MGGRRLRRGGPRKDKHDVPDQHLRLCRPQPTPPLETSDAGGAPTQAAAKQRTLLFPPLPFDRTEDSDLFLMTKCTLGGLMPCWQQAGMPETYDFLYSWNSI